jgi:4-hydroxythreonine-4-phosphate dehydrogenase
LNRCPRIVLTSGEPAGIGPDLCVGLTQQKQNCEIIVVVDPVLIKERASKLGIQIKLQLADLSASPSISPLGELRYLPVELAEQVEAGTLNNKNSHYVISMLQLALDGCLDGRFDAVVTAPVHKGVINEANMVFSGHTEFFADGAGIEKVVMMLATPELRVALATTHLPLIQVSQAITIDSLTEVLAIIVDSMKQQFGLASPKIAVCGLNPHAGEGGYLGTEEIEVIEPVIAAFKNRGIQVSGPWPADTVFVQEKLDQFDVVLAMYHDQGLPVLKHQGFGKAVNITLGLPFIRTSVDHGTALDLAASGKASVSSLQAAIDMANTMIESRKYNG